MSFKKNRQIQFTPAVQVKYALNYTIDEFFEETPEDRYDKYTKSYKMRRAALQKLGLKILLPVEQHVGSITSVLEPVDESCSFNDFHDYLYEKGDTIYPGKVVDITTFRIANIRVFGNTDITYFRNIVDTYLDINKINQAKLDYSEPYEKI